jgi:autoinducer 2-degrading protein
MAFVVAATWIARPEEEDAVAAALTQMIPLSREEPGNLVYQVHRSTENRCLFFIYEQYVDRDAFDSHVASTHFAEIGQDAIARLASREREFFETWPQ